MDEPLSTISNAAYAMAGYWVLERSTEPIQYLFGGTLFVLAISSALYHGMPKSKTWAPTPGQRMDEVSMYWVLAALIANIGMAFWPHAAIPYAAILAMFVLGAAHGRIDSADAIPALSAVALLLLAVAGLWVHALALGAWFAAAAAIRACGERAKRGGRERLHDALHTVWHCMTGPGFAASFPIIWTAAT